MKRSAIPPLEGRPDRADGDDDEAYARARARYEADPLLALVESYVLDAIGELTAEEVEEASAAAEELLGAARDWRGAVRRAMRWPATLDGAIERDWSRFREERQARGEDPEAAEFARRFADAAARLARS